MIFEFKTKRDINGHRKYIAINTGAETFSRNCRYMVIEGIEISATDYKAILEKLHVEMKSKIKIGICVLACGIGIGIWGAELKSPRGNEIEKPKIKNAYPKHRTMHITLDGVEYELIKPTFRDNEWMRMNGESYTTIYLHTAEERAKAIQIENPISISDEDRYIVECIVAGEAKGESYKGKKLVAQCIYNAMLRDGLSAKEVKSKFQYSGWDENLKSTNLEAYNEVKMAISEVFDFGMFEVDDDILYFYAPKYCKGDWHESQRFVIEEGGHKFFAEN